MSILEGRDIMIDLQQVLTSRLICIGHIADNGVVPGELDTYELQELIGRIKELQFILKLLAANDIAGEISKFIED